jgi:N-acetylneuraminic acid mutarotase
MYGGTDGEMFIWGGTQDYSTGLNSGGRWYPATDTWRTISTTTTAEYNSDARYEHSAVPRTDNTGTVFEMIVWGGHSGSTLLGTGARYDALRDSWTSTSFVDEPSGRYGHTAVWTGSQMILFGGYDGSTVYNSVYSYTPSRTMYLYQRP